MRNHAAVPIENDAYPDAREICAGAMQRNDDDA